MRFRARIEVEVIVEAPTSAAVSRRLRNWIKGGDYPAAGLVQFGIEEIVDELKLTGMPSLIQQADAARQGAVAEVNERGDVVYRRQ